MGCTNCSQPTASFSIPFMQNQTSSQGLDARNVVYTGPDLLCLNISTNSCLQDIVQSIDAKVCQFVGDYSQYNFHCLSSLYSITDEGSFVSAITDYSCNTRTQVASLTTLITNNQNTTNAALTAITSPNLTSPCSSIVYGTNSTLKQVITAQSNAICSINTSLALTGVVWNNCFTVTTTPTTIVQGFTEVLNQICLVKASIATAGISPTFNNTGTCLANPTSSDSLVDTILKIRTRLCNTSTFLASNLNSSTCVAFNSSSTLEGVINSQNSVIDSISLNSIRAASSDFVITAIDASNPCLGKTIALNTGVVDRKVALNSSDVTPGTLFDKVVQGTNVTLDFGTTNPGKLTISATGGAANDEKVKVNSSDTTAGYLEDKLDGDSSTGITVSTNTISNSTIQITAVLDFSVIAEEVLNAIAADVNLKALFCNLVSSCPVACAAPSNASVTLT